MNSSNQTVSRVAVLSDIHGNIHALNTVLEEVEQAQPDAIVVCGDVAAGPFPSESIERLMKLGGPAYFVRGNADREFVTAYDYRVQFDPDEENPARRMAAWGAQQIDQRQRDFLASFADRVVLDVAGMGRVLFCHGTPSSEDEIITQLTPEVDLTRLLAGVDAKTVVCGHTHHQFDRQAGSYRVINPGSVGMPYQGEPGAYWALMGPEVDFRQTEYDTEQAIEQAEFAGYPDPSYQETILAPRSAEEAAEIFEQMAAERGERGETK